MPATIQEHADLNQALQELTRHPSWEQLAAVVQERRDRFLTSLTRRLLAGEPVNQREIDRLRGEIEALDWLIQQPDKQLRRTKRLIRDEKQREEQGSE